MRFSPWRASSEPPRAWRSSALSRPQAHQDAPTEDCTPDQTHDWWERRSSAPKCTLLLGLCHINCPNGQLTEAGPPQARCLSFLWSPRQRSLRFRDGGILESGGRRTLAWSLWFPATWSPRTGAGNARHHASGPSLLRSPSGVEPAAMVAVFRVIEEQQARWLQAYSNRRQPFLRW